MTVWRKSAMRFFDRVARELPFETAAKSEVLNERFARHLAGDERPEDRAPLQPLTKREEFFAGILQSQFEIFFTLRRTELASDFLRKLRLRDTTAEIISYHVEKSFEELYILKERLIRFIRRLARLLKKRGLTTESQKLDLLEKIILRAFKDVLRIRGSHVHDWRFDDVDIRRVATLDLLVTVGRKKSLLPLRSLHAKSALARWRKVTRANMRACNKLWSQMIKVVEPIVFEKLAPPN